MNYRIDIINEWEYPEVADLWEASVRATHHFLREEDIGVLKPLILHEYLKAVALTCVRNDDNRILGFMGVAKGKLEMLFIHPEAIGKGIGKKLLAYAVEELKVYQVDVNEDNKQAIGFYEHMGFEIVERSDVDGMGKPYPILHMERYGNSQQ